MAPYIFCIIIPLIYNNPNGTYHYYNDYYECFKTKEKCSKKLSEEKYFLKRFQNDPRIKKEPFCQKESLKREIIIDNIEENKEEPVKKSCWLFC